MNEEILPSAVATDAALQPSTPGTENSPSGEIPSHLAEEIVAQAAAPQVIEVQSERLETHVVEPSIAATPTLELQPVTASTVQAIAPAALPEAHLSEPPRPLVAGAFLGGEFEVKDLISRGLTNFYLAFGGDYSSPIPKFVAEREVENPTGHATLESALFPETKFVIAEKREYLIFDWIETLPLQDWREVANDARYLQVLSTLVAGMRELESKNLIADFSRETLRFDANGELKFFGFVNALPESSAQQASLSGLENLRLLNTFLLRQVFGESSTIRLDDQWSALAMSEEVKNFARSVETEYSSIEEVAAALQLLHGEGVLRADAALLSDVGQEREINEDSGTILRFARGGHEVDYDIELYVVSDGMGGHEGGEVASALTLSTLQQSIFSRLNLDWNDNVAVRMVLNDVIEEVNNAVIALAEEAKYRASRAKPGATLTFAVRIGPRVFFVNIGDSRAYKWSEKLGLQRVTKDHSYVQTLIDSGQLTEDQAWEHPDGSIITAHIGMQKLRQRDVFLRLVSPEDKIVIVSDGVIDMLRETEIEPILHEATSRAVCRKLVDASNAAGGMDNITVVCVNFS